MIRGRSEKSRKVSRMMRRTLISLLIIAGLIAVGAVMMVYFKQSKNQIEPKKLTAKFTFGKKGKEFEEFNRPVDVAVKDNFLFVADSGNSRIQVLKINPDGSLSPVLSFGKEGKGLGEFKYLSSFAVKNNYFYITDAGNNRVQVLEIK
ncbi:MAG: hypothetical protein KKH34_08095 [Candidatus Omnitrophica bacterium]|nr:hypothetical protein [Candidatus Omnitrophota bacterium]